MLFAVCGSTFGGEGGLYMLRLNLLSFCSCLCVHVFLFVCLCVCMNMGGPLCAEVEGIWSRSTPLHAGHEALLPGLQSTALSFSMPDDQKGCYCQPSGAIAGFLMLLTMVCYSYWCSIAVICLEKLPPKNVP